MGKRKEYTLNATIKKKEKTEQGKLIENEFIKSYIDQLLLFANKKSEDEKLAN